MSKRIVQDPDVRPNRFTGKWKGQYFYKGHRWLGATNRVGCGELILIQPDPGDFGHGQWGLVSK